MQKSSPLVGRLILLFLTIVGFLIVITQSSTFLFKDYFESNSYVYEERDFLAGLDYFILNPIDKEASLAAITVSDAEVEYYRNYYGTLSEQVIQIQEQYNDTILELEDNKNEVVVKALIEERDNKIAEIKRNFEDENYVKEKIINSKTKTLNKFLAEYEQEKKLFLSMYSYYGYSLKDSEGIKVNTGNASDSRVFDKQITISSGLLEDGYRHDFVTDRNTGDEAGIDISESIELVRGEKTYKGSIFITKDEFEHVGSEGDYYTFTIIKWMYYLLIVVAIISVILLTTKFKFKKEHFAYFYVVKEKLPRWPIDIMLVLGAIFVYFGFEMIEGLIYTLASIPYMVRYSNPTYFFEIAIPLVFSFTLLVLAVYAIWYVITAIKETPLNELPAHLFTIKIIQMFKELFLNRTIAMQTLFLFVVFYLGGVGLYIGMDNAGYFLFYTFLFVTVLVPATFIYLSRMGYLNKVMKQTELMAEGKLTEEITVRGKSPIAKHASNLNALQEGVKKSVTEQAKSERLKTELITNVSHDLRTPLTSIITYTDLLKNPNLTNEERMKYVSILDQKSERLKVLIEDLFEVSKMASGNVELQKNKIDIAQLLQQIVGERTEEFTKENLDLRMTISTQPIFALVDAQKLYRVFDNFLNNALKYALPGTRVYANLEATNGKFVFTMKNVSKYELSNDVNELTERFKRADLARHTEGSGLGLAIATSIIDLHQGTLALETDGDLFKLKMEVPLNV